MKNLLFAGLAGVLTMAPGAALAAIESPANGDSPVDMSFASPTALATGIQGMKTTTTKMGGHGMRGMRKMGTRKMKRMGGGHRMKRMGMGQRVKMGRHGAGKHVRRGRMGYGRGYRRPHRGFRLPQTFIQPSYFIGNFGHYGLSRPSAGYGWSRYYDDAVLTDRRGVVQDSRQNVNWDRYNQGYNDGFAAGRATYDQSVFSGDDRVIASPAGYQGGGTTYQGNWNGAYQQDGSYEGDWQGTYRGEDGHTYEGQYSGKFIGEGAAAPTGANYTNAAPHWGGDSRSQTNYRGQSDDMAYLERCKKSSGIGGAIVGGAIGALAGNRIAGQGNRLGGSLIGGGVGAIAGAAIDQGSDRCRKLIKKYEKRESYGRAPAQRQYRQAPVQHRQYPNGWQGGYYYQQQAPTVTTIVIQSQPVTTTTTTTTVEEEVYYTKAASKKRYKPAAKRVWKPRAKAAPVALKGCQQERCYYDD